MGVFKGACPLNRILVDEVNGNAVLFIWGSIFELDYDEVEFLRIRQWPGTFYVVWRKMTYQVKQGVKYSQVRYTYTPPNKPYSRMANVKQALTASQSNSSY